MYNGQLYDLSTCSGTMYNGQLYDLSTCFVTMYQEMTLTCMIWCSHICNIYVKLIYLFSSFKLLSVLHVFHHEQYNNKHLILFQFYYSSNRAYHHIQTWPAHMVTYAEL